MAGQNQGTNMDLFDAYFRRADLDQDGRISGAEAVGFFQGSNLPKQVLAQIWTYADQNRTGFLGRVEFYNALKLVTVAQSKRELTPDIVKAALYGPASAKIPAPQINLAAILAPQPNLNVGTPAPQLSGTAPTASQSTGIRGPQGFTPQQNQFMRPPRPSPPSTGFHSQLGVASQGMSGGGTMTAFRPPSSSISTDWQGGRTGGPPAGVTSQVPTRGISPSTTLDGFGLSASGSTPLTQPRSQATTGLTQSAAPKPNDPTLSAYHVGEGTKDSKALAVSGNGFAPDPIFGDVFSATSSQVKQDSLAPTSAAGGLPVSSAIVSASAGPQHVVKPSQPESLQIGFTQQPAGSQRQQIQSTVKQNQQGSMQSSNAYPGGPGNSASGQSQLPWPRMTQSDVQKYGKVFVEVDKDRDGKISGEQARNLFLSWRLPREVLKQVWDLSDQDNDSMLSLREFCIALYLMERYREGRPLPKVLPSGIMLEETLWPASGQLAASHGNASRIPTPGLQQAQGITGARQATTAAGGRPPRPVPIPPADEPMQPRQQRTRVPVLEKHLVDQLSTEEQNSLSSKFQEATEADKKVEELEKEILDSKEKIEFYRTKMQELILYKSRCDNRLNEVTERVSADKREVETLAKKYEEKYKQSGDVASKLTIEEATFRDIQEKKMELYREIVKLEQDGNPDGIQVRADRIQLNLEEQVKDLNERCKIYGLRAKPTSLVELPYGWQPGFPEGAADLDEDWDKFEDEGFTIVKELTLDVQNVIAPPKQKSLVRNKASSTDEGSTAVSSSNADKLENLPGARERTREDELSNAQSEEDVAGSSPDSPVRRNAVESPSKKFQDSPSRKSSSGYGSPHAVETQSEHGGAESVLSGDKSFDESGWGTFDTHYDTDAGWDISSVTAKDTNHESHNESSLFGPDDWGLNPIRTEPVRTDNTFQKKSAFPFADSVPSTPAYSSVNSPQADKFFQKKSPFGFADSVPSTPLFSSSNSPNADKMFQKKSPFAFADSVPSTPMSEDHSFDNFSRFDSFSMHDGGNPNFSRFDSFSTHDGGPSDFSRFDSFSMQDSGQSNFSKFDSFSTHDGGVFPQRESFQRFDSISSTRDSDYDHGFLPPNESFTRFDSMRSTRDSDYGQELFPPHDSFTRFDSFRSTKDSDYSHGFPSFDDTDPFGSSDPFKTSLESQTPRRDSDSWKAF